jgi:hypothetical protein
VSSDFANEPEFKSSHRRDGKIPGEMGWPQHISLSFRLSEAPVDDTNMKEEDDPGNSGDLSESYF